MEVEKIVVVGGSGQVGREVCRLGVALGHELISVCLKGEAPTGEPWTEGVVWIRGDVERDGNWQTALEGAHAVVVVPDVDGAVVDASRGATTKVVWLARGQEAAGILDQRDTRAVVGSVSTEHHIMSDQHVIRVEQLAMALLRLSLEPRPGITPHEELVRLGDAMMIQ